MQVSYMYIRSAFVSFHNFKQDFINENELNGIGTAELNIESYWKPGLIFDDEKLKIKSHLIIEKGELIDFKPLEKLSSYISIDELKHVKFSTLENTIEVSDKIIKIPTMEINSSALSVFLSGTHTFEQDINYSIKLLLSELLSSKFRKKNTGSENKFGEIDRNGKPFTTLYLKMVGKTDSPKIYFDGLGINENLKKRIKQEKETITTIIKQDVLKSQKREKENDDNDIIIEWKDE